MIKKDLDGTDHSLLVISKFVLRVFVLSVLDKNKDPDAQLPGVFEWDSPLPGTTLHPLEIGILSFFLFRAL